MTDDLASVADGLGPRWEWEEIAAYGQPTFYVKTRCLHLGPVPVHAVDGALVARLCPDCDTQLPPEWTP